MFPDFPPENHLSSTSSPGDSGKCALSPEARSGHVTKRQPIRTLPSPPTLLPIPEGLVSVAGLEGKKRPLSRTFDSLRVMDDQQPWPEKLQSPG